MSSVHNILVISETNFYEQQILPALKKGDSSDYNLKHAPNLKTAREIMTAGNYDLVISDYSLPDGKGYEALPKVENGGKLPIILLLEAGNEEQLKDSLNAGVLDYLFKSKDFIRDLKQRVERALWISGLIDENRELKKSLRQKDENLNLALKSVNISYWEWKIGAEDINLSKRFYEMLGYDENEIESKTTAWAKINYPDDIPLVRNKIQEYLDGKTDIYECEHRLRAKSGEWKWFLDRGRVVEWDENNKPVKMVGTHLDITSRKQVEIDLSLSEERYRFLVENQREGIVLTDLHDKITFCNPAAERISGFEKGTMQGKLLKELLTDEYYKKVKYHIDEALAGRNSEYIFYYIDTNNTKRYLQISTNPWHDKSGKIIGTFGIFRDITEQKTADKVSKRSRRILQNILDTIPVRVYWKDRESKYLGCNSLFALDAGLKSPSEIVKKTDYDLCWKESAGERIEEDRRIIESGIPKLNFEAERVNADDKELWVLNSKVPLTDIDGEIIGVLGTYTDITQWNKTSEELKINKAFMEELFEGAPEAIVILDNDDKVLRMNREFTRLFEYSPQDAVGKKINELIVPQELWNEGYETTGKVAHGEKVIFETVRMKKSGEKVHVSVLGNPIKLDENQIAVYGTYRDITDKKIAEDEKLLLEEQLRQSQKMESIGRLAGGVAHDFNNLLSAIIGHADLMLIKIHKEDPLYDGIKLILETATRAANLTSQLLAFGRKQMLQMKVLNLNKEVEDLQKMLRRIIGEDVELKTKLLSDLGMVKADPAQIQQILVNLAVNARDAMPEGGELLIETDNAYLDEEYCQNNTEVIPGNYVMIKVSDNGIGMDAETLEHIFEPFFTTKEVGKGTGLGLSTIYGIVKQHGGHVSVVSEVGKGTTFRICFAKVNEEIIDDGIPTVMRSTAKGQETVLVVEDEEAVRMLICDILEEHGYNILVASNAHEALKIFNEIDGQIDLLLTDVVMPKMDGKELYKRLKSARSDLKALFISGYTEKAITERNILYDSEHFLPKPFSVHKLTNKVREILDLQLPGNKP